MLLSEAEMPAEKRRIQERERERERQRDRERERERERTPGGSKGDHKRTMLECTGLKSRMLNNCNLKKDIGYFRDPFKDLA